MSWLEFQPSFGGLTFNRGHGWAPDIDFLNYIYTCIKMYTLGVQVGHQKNSRVFPKRFQFSHHGTKSPDLPPLPPKKKTNRYPTWVYVWKKIHLPKATLLVSTLNFGVYFVQVRLLPQTWNDLEIAPAILIWMALVSSKHFRTFP